MIVFILGANRIGSTLLDLMLSSNKDCVSVGELKLYNIRSCSYCGKSCAKWKDFDRVYKKTQNHHQAAKIIYPGKILIDSSKNIKWIRNTLKTENNYKIIRVIRNGFDRLLIYKQKYNKIEKNYITKWICKEKLVKKFLKNKDHITVKYEDVCNNKGLINCCNYIGVEYEESMRRYWEFEHHGLGGSYKTYSLVKSYHSRLLNSKEHNFVEDHGFKTKVRKKYNFMNDKELLMWHKYGEKFNIKLGYEKTMY